MNDEEKVLEDIKNTLDNWWNHKHLPKRIGFVYTIGGIGIEAIDREKRGNHMQFTGMSVGWTVAVKGIGINADGTQNPATLSNQQDQTSDPTVATVAADPANPGGAIITLVGTPTATGISCTLTETATATAGALTGVVTGSDTLSFVSGVPPTGLPTSLAFTYGTPAPPGPPPPPPPPPPAGKRF